jgi:serine/threonine protein kinase
MGQAIGLARVEDRYHLQKIKLGQGSFGTVWRAVDKGDSSLAAIKQLDKALIRHRGVQQQHLEREYKIMQSVSHENITRCLGTFEDDRNIYIALEYCESGDLGDKVKAVKDSLTENLAAEWVRQVLAAIAALHEKSICHRDIKPDNYLISSNETLKLSDFGLAISVPFGKVLTEKCGTPAFMSPEQHKLPRHSKGYNHLCDMWAAGVTMYMILFGGSHPFLDSEQRIDERKLVNAELDFKVVQGFFGFNQANSESSRLLCQRLVEPSLQKRYTAVRALQDPWIPRSDLDFGDRPFRSITAPVLGISSPIDSQLELEPLRGTTGSQPLSGLTVVQDYEEPHLKEVQQSHRRCSGSWFDIVRQSLACFQGGGVSIHKDFEDGIGYDWLATPSYCVSRSSRLPPGTKCSYFSSSWSTWVPAKIQGFNDMDGTYDLDVRQGAKLENIAPAADAKAHDAWPVGTLVTYDSNTHENMRIPAVIRSFNESIGNKCSYNLCVRDFASVDRIRPRIA